MKNQWKKVISFLLAAAMVFSLGGMTTFAAEADDAAAQDAAGSEESAQEETEPEAVSEEEAEPAATEEAAEAEADPEAEDAQIETLSAEEEDGIVPLADGDYNVKYAVCIWGINQDKYLDENGEEATAPLTFGPATGGNYVSSYKSCTSEYCIHDMTWEQIIKQCEEDPTVFQSCLDNGCTHSVEIDLNSKLLATDYSSMTGDGAGMLSDSINSSYRTWNATATNTGGWPASRIRATLNGADDYTQSSVAGSDTLSAEESLFSCFPEVLQDAIVAREVTSDTTYSHSEEDYVTTNDKLWLYSGIEMYENSGTSTVPFRDNEGTLSQRSSHLKITTGDTASMINYKESGTAAVWWMRTLWSTASYVCHVGSMGTLSSTAPNSTSDGIAPGFCIGAASSSDTPDTGSGTADVKYAVSIWGINQDVDEAGNPLVTFGPATGGDYTSTSKESCGADKCIHNMTWEQIIAQCADDATVFESCLENGCTHSVDLALNDTIAGTKYPDMTGDGAGMLLQSINTSYRTWNISSFPYNNGGWPASRIRATLNGADGSTNTQVAGSDALDSSDCLLSCFPSELQENIVAKAVKSDIKYDDRENEEYNETTYDKLWLFSGTETYGQAGGSTTVTRPNEGTLYKRSELLGITTANGTEAPLTNYDEDGTASPWWLRTLYTTASQVAHVNASGVWNSRTLAYTTDGIAPGFCLLGSASTETAPTVTGATITATGLDTDNTKTEDGEKVTLTVTATVTPEDLAPTYQWSKDGTDLEGETNATLTLDGVESDSGTYKCVVTATNGDLTASDSAEITITINPASTGSDSYDVKYAVTIWGINQDTYSTDGGETTGTAGLTFGPATGANYISSSASHLSKEQVENGEGYCIHWMSWDEIAEQSKENPEVFEDCLKNGCTKAVGITLSTPLTPELFDPISMSGDGAGTLYNGINSSYRKWNNSSTTSGGWPASRIRATLNGADGSTNETVNGAGTDVLDADDCLFSCFPEDLQAVIVPKAVKSDTEYNDESGNNVTTYDNLWLFSGKEIYKDGSSGNQIRPNEGVAYQKAEQLGITPDNYSALVNYMEGGTAHSWWLRSLSHSNGTNVYRIMESGDWATTTAGQYDQSVSPGFCLAGPETTVEEPTVTDITITSGLTDNTKTYDGEGVTLTLSAEVSPDTATVSYQWYKGDDPIETLSLMPSDNMSTRLFAMDVQPYAAAGDTCKLAGNVSDTGSYKCELTVTNDGETTTVDSDEITVTINPATQKIVFKEDPVTKETTDDPFTNGLDEEESVVYGTLSYSTGDDKVATVVNDGTVTIVGAGTTEITATAAGDEVNEQKNYEAVSASYTLTVSESASGGSNVKYAVCIWGINQDTYKDDEGNEGTAGLTFGPATGADYTGTYEAHLTEDQYNASNDAYCIHWMSWSEIAEQSKTNPEVFEDCLKNGCTKSVDIAVNDTLLNSGYETVEMNGDGAGMLFESILPVYRRWDNDLLQEGSSEGGWPASRMRATLNGADTLTDADVAGSDTLTTDNCLFSCFPEELQDEIVPKAVKSDTAYDPDVGDNTTTYDKLWLFSGKEILNKGNYFNTPIRDSEGVLYQRSEQLGITTQENYSNLISYDEKGTAEAWWLRTRYAMSYLSVYHIQSNGECNSRNTLNENDGLNPGFCLAGPSEEESPAINYAVKIWGIGVDEYSEDDGETTQTAGLTFGPALGDSENYDRSGYINAYKAHLTEDECNPEEGKYCIHWMTWDEIIAQNAEDPSVFEDCLENGCTKAVELTPKEKLFNMTAVDNVLEQNYTGDGVSTLFYLLNGTGSESWTEGAIWNFTYSYDNSDPSNLYSQSRIRATLNGDSGDASKTYAGSNLCDGTNCLLSCFPQELQEAIVPRATVNAGDGSSWGGSAKDKETYDKLWLLSPVEAGIDMSSDHYYDGGGTDYKIASANSDRIAYEYTSAAATAFMARGWWTRSRYDDSEANIAYYVNSSGSKSDNYYVTQGEGLSPCFSLPGSETEETEDPTVRYAVSIWGINADEDADGNLLGLTFGPATGETNYVHTYKAHLDENEYSPASGKFCIHWMTWDEIIEQCKTDPTVFQDCLDEGCTHTVVLTLNSTIRNASFTTLPWNAGDGGGQLFSCIDSDYLKWNSSATTEGGWPASQIRAVLNGKDDLTGDNAANALDAKDSLFSCFPSELQEGIVAKAVKSDTVYDDTDDNNKTTYDKLWLFSGIEAWGPGGYSDSALRENEGSLYERSSKLGITTQDYEGLKTFDETGDSLTSVRGWWTRTQYKYNNTYPIVVGYLGDWNADIATSATNGLSPGFCLAGPYYEQPTVTDVTIATEGLGADNTKTYDGEKVTLTASATTTPTDATVTYQWYKVDGDDVTEIAGETGSSLELEGKVSDSGTYRCVVTATNGNKTADDYADITITINAAEASVVKYAVKIWGIQTDKYSTDDGETTQTAGLTFGPALGEDHLNSSVSCGSEYCIHDMSWTDIIAQSEKDPSVFQTCLEKGCTKTVELTPNDTIFNMATVENAQLQNFEGDGVSTLFYLLNGTGNANANWSRGANWNYANSNATTSDPANVYSKSRIRVTLNGDPTDAEMKYASSNDGEDLCDSKTCLLACFPTELQSAIVPRLTENTGNATSTRYSSAEDKTTYDKLFLFSLAEVGVVDPYGYDDSGGSNYNIAASNSARVAYEFASESNLTATASTWWTRSRYLPDASQAYLIYTGGAASNYTSVYYSGLSPAFCLAGPTIEEPTVSDVKITADGLDEDNTKTEDGNPVTLTVSATTTPSGATVTYQWYKKNDAGEYEEITGETEATLTLAGEVSDTGTYKCEVTATNDPLTATGSAEITITIKEALQTGTVNYAVKIWGIQKDTYQDEAGEEKIAALTFGPALGADYTNDSVSCDSAYCIHKLSWDDIIKQCEENPEVFESCLKNGCTKAVELTPNETLFNMTTVNNYLEQDYTGDGVSALSYLLNGEGADWNYTTSGASSDDPANIYSRSRIRAALTGDSTDARAQVAAGGKDYYGLDTICDENTCLFSCFPDELQSAIMPRKTVNAGEPTTGSSAGDKTTYDKLFLFSLKELGDTTRELDDAGGDDYGVTPSTSDRIAYEFSSNSATTVEEQFWWTRSRISNSNATAYFMAQNGADGPYNVSYQLGLSPGFCIAGSGETALSVDVKITAEGLDGNNTKVYDGKPVTLTATATVTPDDAQTAYQWYKENDAGEYEPITGETGATLELAGEVSDTGTYKCEVTATYEGRTATGSDEITITITEVPVVNYAVRIWGIQKDTYKDESGNEGIAGLTFGPATGDSYLDSFVSCDSDYCIHNMSWADIIAQSEKDPTVFDSCLEHGCTKAVPLTTNSDLFDMDVANNAMAQDYTGDGVGTLFYLIGDASYSAVRTGHGLWNLNYSGNSISDPANVYSRSRIRTTLNGDSSNIDAWLAEGSHNNYYYSEEYPLFDESNCLLSCFPAELQEAIVARETVNGGNATAGDYKYADEETYDKLWLFSLKEVGIDYNWDDAGGTDYGVISQNSERIAYEFSDEKAASGEGQYWWTRSRHSGSTANAFRITNETTSGYSSGYPYYGYGLSPSFCLAGPEVEKPTVENVTIKASDLDDDNAKVYDGVGFELSVTADVTPDDAAVTYQWYGPDGEPIEGATDDTYFVSGKVADSGTYTCEVTATDAAGSTTASGEITVTIKPAPQNIYYTEETMEKVVGDADFTNPLTVDGLSPEEGAGVTYASSDASVATVDPDTGLVTIVGAGEATITATAAATANYAEANDSYTLTVEEKLSVSVTVTSNDPDNTKTYDGAGVNLTATAEANIEDAELSYQWYTVAEDGTATEIDGANFASYITGSNVADSGTYRCVVTATYKEQTATAQADIKITITKAAQEISYAETALEKMTTDEAFTNPLTETKVDTEGGAVITYTSSDETIATVDENGKVTILAAGEVTITATVSETDNYNSAEASYTITITVDKRALQAEYDEDIQLNEDDYTPDSWAPFEEALENAKTVLDDPDVTQKDVDDALKALQDAKAGLKEKVAPTVSVTVTSNLTDNTKTYDGAGANLTASAEVTPDTAEVSYQWYKVAEDGTATEIDGATFAAYITGSNVADSGTYRCVVTATNDGITATAQADIAITIKKAAQDISYADTALEKMTTDEAFTNPLTETKVDTEGGAAITYATSDETIATVDENGKVTILAAGEVTITATVSETDNYSSAEASYTITITVDKRALQAEYDEDIQLNEDDYTPDSWAPFEEALENAKTVLDDPDVTQKDVDDALKSLQDAKAGLKEKVAPTVSVTVTSNLTDNTKTYDGAGANLAASAEVTPDTAAVSYQWYKVAEDGTATEIDGATFAAYITGSNVADSGTYRCVVTATNDGITATAQADIAITITKAAQDISYETTLVTKYDYDEEFTKELTETIVEGQITYRSSDESVATVNAETGAVDIHNPGTTTITATAAATDNYEEATASYALVVNSDFIKWEIDVDGSAVEYDEQSGEYVDDISYTGEPMELEMMLSLTEEEMEEVEDISYQWYVYDSGTEPIRLLADEPGFQPIPGATDSTYTLEGDAVNAGDYVYMCTAVVTYKNGYEHSVYSPIEIIIEKAKQVIYYDETAIEKLTTDVPFTNPLTEEKVDPEATITYASSDETIATVDENGEVTILAAGEVTITATASATDNYEEATASYTITIDTVAPTLSVTITSNLPDNTKTYDGAGANLTATVTVEPEGAEVSYQWYKDDEAIDGAISSVYTTGSNVADSGTYKCVVTATHDGITETAEAEITITIEKAAQDISYDETHVTKYTYDEDFINELTKTLVYPADGSGITYSSTSTDVATVDETTGEVAIHGIGTATITATAAGTDNYNEATASYVLVVNEDTVDWEINVNNRATKWDEEKQEWVDDLAYNGQDLEIEMVVKLDEGEEEELDTIHYQWYLYNPETLEFEEITGATESTYTMTGKAVDAGDYIYMCQTDVVYKNDDADTIYGSIEVIIEKAAQEISYEETALEKLTTDEPFTNPLTETTVDPEATITYTSSDESIATVDENGEVTILASGEVTITATVSATDNYEEATASYTITIDTVAPTVSDVTITSTLPDNTKTYDGTGASLTVTADVEPDTAEVSYQWYKDGEAIEGATGDTLNIDGNVSDSGTYKCVVTATHDGLTAEDSAEITITIEKADQEISYEETTIDKTVGDEPFTNALTETKVDTEGGAVITYTSSDESIATVDENGEVTILAEGEVTITATVSETDNYNSTEASYTITIAEPSPGPEPTPVVDKEVLESAISDAVALTESDYTPDTWATLQTALEAAQKVDADETVTQADVDAATIDLVSALANLQFAEVPPAVQPDKTDLLNEYVEGMKLDESNYTPESWEPFAQALADAQSVLTNPDATQEDVDAAEQALKAAMDNLVESGPVKNGLCRIEAGKLWGYYVDDVVDETYTGFASNENGDWWVVDGYVRFDVNSVEKDPTGKNGDKGVSDKGTWWYVVGNKVQHDFTGLANYKNANGWWYIVDGKVDFNHNGVDKNKNGWYYVMNGKVRFDFTGLSNYKNANGWWYIAGGKVDFTHNGVDKNQSGWYYVLNGKVRFDYTGVSNYSNKNGWWFIKDGRVDFNYTGKASNKNGTWNVVNGKVVF